MVDSSILTRFSTPNNTGVIKAFQNTLLNKASIDAQAQALKEDIANAPLRNQLLESQAGQAQQQALQQRDKNRISSIVMGAAELMLTIEGGDANAVMSDLLQRKARLDEQIQQGFDVNTEDTDQAIAILSQPDGLAKLRAATERVITFGQQAGILGQGLTTAQRNTISETEGFSKADKLSSRRIDAGLDPRAVGASAKITMIANVPHIFDPNTKKMVPVEIAGKDVTATQIAETEKVISKAKETGKLSSQLVLKPQIEAAVTKARARAAEDGEVFTDLSRMKAALPGLRETVAQLKDLSLVATSTLGGKAFDFMVKESGFGATKGSTARAKFIALVNNQVLPLLKPTFGAAFTVPEGQELKATMGDPNSTPEEKLAQLNAFIDQKERDIRTKSRELGIIEAQALSDEDLFK